MPQLSERSQEEMIPLVVTRNEAIAIGEIIFSYYNYLREQEKLTPEQQFLARHLSNFYERLTTQVLPD
jgi:hypothetical protein